MRIVLRPITLEDGNLIVQWRNDESIRNHCMSRNEVTLESNARFYNQFVATGKYKQYIAERIEEDFGVIAYPIATVYLKDMDYGNKRCELCIFTSTDDEWRSDSQSLAIKMLLEKAVGEYGMHKVYSYVFCRYAEEVELLKKAGFEVETILKDEVLFDRDHYEDVVRLCIYNK